MGSQRQLVTKLLENINGGHEVAAAHLGMSIGMFRDRLYMNKARFFDLDEVLKLQELSGTTLVADYYAAQAGCLVVKKAEPNLGSYDFFETMLLLGKARGKYEAYLQQALEDGKIDEEEAKKLDEYCNGIMSLRSGMNELMKAAHKKTTNA